MRASFDEEKDRNIYSRYSNPNTSEFIDKMVIMEKVEAGFAFASGMAAVLNSLDHIGACKSLLVIHFAANIVAKLLLYLILH